MCLYPRIIKNRKYVANKKNKGIVPQMKDPRVQYVPVGCGKCMECKKKKANEWKVRLSEEVRNRNDGIFVTLTFSDESIKELGETIKGLEGYNRDNEIATVGVRRFLERWRKKHKKSVRHWLVTELGHNGTENIHMHGIIWTDKGGDEIEKIWKYGHVWTSDRNKGYVNERTINYIVKYVNKTDERNKDYQSKILTSNGIGRRYTERMDSTKNEYKPKKTKEVYTNRQGYKVALPIYYRNKIYSEEEREKLWLEKLDKQERYINGQKIDVSKNEDDYWATLKEARKLNKELGYGDNEINWERKRYENQRRNLMYKKRKGRAK